MYTSIAAELLKRPLRTVQTHCKKLKFSKLNTSYIIQDEKEFNRLKDSLDNSKPGNPNFNRKE